MKDGRFFYGHGAFSPDGKYLYLTEVDGRKAYAFERQVEKPAAEVARADGLFVAISRPSFESWFLLHLRDGLPAMATCSEVCHEISAITKRSHGREYRKDSKNNIDLFWLIEKILPSTSEAIARATRIEKTAFMSHSLVPDQSGTKVHKLVQILWAASRRGIAEASRAAAAKPLSPP